MKHTSLHNYFIAIFFLVLTNVSYGYTSYAAPVNYTNTNNHQYDLNNIFNFEYSPSIQRNEIKYLLRSFNSRDEALKWISSFSHSTPQNRPQNHASLEYSGNPLYQCIVNNKLKTLDLMLEIFPRVDRDVVIFLICRAMDLVSKNKINNPEHLDNILIHYTARHYTSIRESLFSNKLINISNRERKHALQVIKSNSKWHQVIRFDNNHSSQKNNPTKDNNKQYAPVYQNYNPYSNRLYYPHHTY
jgi:hypothetical protein